VKPPVTVTVCESGLVTTTSTRPAEWAAVVAVRLVALPKATTAAAPPNVTVGSEDEVGAGDGHHGAPPVEPVTGLSEVTVGAGVGAT